MKFYVTDANGVFASEIELDPFGPVPAGSTTTPPPATTGTEVAQLQSFQWVVLPEYPVVAPPQPAVPASVTMRQARLALLGAGLLDDVDAAIAAIPDATVRRAAQIEWEFSNEVQRHNSFTAMLGAGLGLTAEQIDALFIQAVTL